MFISIIDTLRGLESCVYEDEAEVRWTYNQYQKHTFFNLDLSQQDYPTIRSKNNADGGYGGAGGENSHCKAILIRRVVEVGNNTWWRRKGGRSEVHDELKTRARRPRRTSTSIAY